MNSAANPAPPPGWLQKNLEPHMTVICDFMLKIMNFILKMMNSVERMMGFMLKMRDFAGDAAV